VGGGIRRLHKSRYDSISRYIYHCTGDPQCMRLFEAYNDLPCAMDEDVKGTLVAAGVDEMLANHIAHLYTRDPLVIFEEYVELDDEKSMDHFENIQVYYPRIC